MQEGMNPHGAWAAKISPRASGTHSPALSQAQIFEQPGNESQIAQTRPEAMLTPPRRTPSILADWEIWAHVTWLD